MVRQIKLLGSRGFWLLLLLLTACGSPPVDPLTPAPAATTGSGYPAGGLPTAAPPAEGYPAPTAVIESGATVQVPAGAQPLVDAAIAELVQRAAVDVSTIQVVEVSPQTWSDASLGCPQEGQLYAQVLTEGYRIVLEAGGQRYAYHTDASSAVFCPQDIP